jgi:hypothetical protein
MAASLLDLRKAGVPRDLRRFLYDKLDNLDYRIIRIAHGARWLLDSTRLKLMPEWCARKGHLELLVYFWTMLDEPDTWQLWRHSDHPICEAAAEHGHLHILQWAKLSGLRVGIASTALMARYGHIAALTWAVESGCPIDFEDCIEEAGKGGHPGIITYLRNLAGRKCQ